MLNATWKVGVALTVLLLLGGCSSVTTVSFDEPLPFVSLAAQEACASAGYEIESSGASSDLKAGRGGRFGFFIGDGGETITVDLTPERTSTEVTIRSQKRFFGFFAQRHLDDRVADFISVYIEENAGIKNKLAEE